MSNSIQNIKVLYEDNHLLVVEKPVNILSQGDNTGDPDLVSLLKDYIKRRYEKPGDVFLGLVHRLDRPVGGVMVFARTSKAASRLSDQIRKREFGKTYLAVIHGSLDKSEGILENYLEKDTRTNTVHAVPSESNTAKKAVLDYVKLATVDALSLVKINLHTGRPHQIRVQFSTSGHPLYGDQKYGSDKNKPGQQIALWAYSLVFIHPTLKKELQFISLPPKCYPWNLFEVQ